MSSPKGEETIFAEALRLPSEERSAYLAQATAGNPQLRQEVESLLRSYGTGDFLEQAAAPQLRPTLQITVPVTEKPGDRIGRYKLLQHIGEGGCVVVYMAEQEEPVSRRVALKVIKLGLDTKSVIARFEAERQALALMDHPDTLRTMYGLAFELHPENHEDWHALAPLLVASGQLDVYREHCRKSAGRFFQFCRRILVKGQEKWDKRNNSLVVSVARRCKPGSRTDRTSADCDWAPCGRKPRDWSGRRS